MSRIFPLTLTLSTNHKRVGGEGEKLWDSDPGRREGFLPLACPGLNSHALKGSQDEAAAALHEKPSISGFAAQLTTHRGNVLARE